MTARRISLAELANRSPSTVDEDAGTTAANLDVGSSSSDAATDPATRARTAGRHPDIAPEEGVATDDAERSAASETDGSEDSMPSSTEPTPPRAHVSQRPSRRAAAGRPATGRAAAVHHLELERKEARLRVDQFESLTSESRRLNRLRNGEGERLTENTLIRVAVDLLLSDRSKLRGKTEAELRKSVGL